ELVDVFDEVLPRAGETFAARLDSQPTFGADFPNDARNARAHISEATYYRVDGVPHAKKVALEWMPIHVKRHLAREISFRDPLEQPRRFGVGKRHRFDERVDRFDGRFPCSARGSQTGALGDLSFDPRHA